MAAEEVSDTRHEFLGGLVYAMAGETRAHNQIVQNVAFALRRSLAQGPCKLYVSDVRVNLDLHSISPPFEATNRSNQAAEWKQKLAGLEKTEK